MERFIPVFNKKGLSALIFNPSPAIPIPMIRIMVMVVVVMVTMVSIKRLCRSLHFSFYLICFILICGAPPEPMAIESVPTVKTSQAISKAIIRAKAKAIVRTRGPLSAGFCR